MLGQLTPQECVMYAQRAIDRLLEKGVCHNCAILVVADQHDIDPDHLEDLWLDWKRAEIRRLNDPDSPETA